MGRSTLEHTGERAPRVDKGHTTRELGPGDSSDTGSDITGGPGLEDDSDALNLQHGTTSDPERSRRPETAGPTSAMKISTATRIRLARVNVRPRGAMRRRRPTN